MVRESRVREEQNSGRIKKKTSFVDSEAYRKLEKEFAQQLQAYLEFELSRSSKTSSCQEDQPHEEGNKPEAASHLPLENEPETDKLEETEEAAVEGELWDESIVQSLHEEEDEEVLVQLEEPQVQGLPAVGDDVGENCIEESQLIIIEG